MYSNERTSHLTATRDLDVIGTAGISSQNNPSQITDFMPKMLISSIQWTIPLISVTFGLNRCITKNLIHICSTIILLSTCLIVPHLHLQTWDLL